MQVFTDDAETALYTYLQTLSFERLHWQVAILYGSRMKPGYQRILRLRESQVMMRDAIQQRAHAVYLFADGDMVFLFREASAHIGYQVGETLRDMFPFLGKERIEENLFGFYPLAKEYDAVLERIRLKKFSKITQGFFDMRAQANAHKQNYVWDAGMFAEAAIHRLMRPRKLALLVEDDGMLRQMAREVLRTQYGILPAADGHAALELYNAQAPDVVFLDIDIPHIDGLKVLKTIMAGDKQAAVVMFTGHKSSAVLQDALRMGAKGFVAKPFAAATLLQHARAAVGAR